ncbi:MAG: ComEA family DNA-binding protein [Desulfobacterales bacterium]|nr:ComEA family DNA-binding protein [Desulfobacterales bacterium]
MRRTRMILVWAVAVALLTAFFPVVNAADNDKININTASVADLCKLNGIGKSNAEKIIRHREGKGPFKKPEDIMQVKGIGQKVWDTNKDRICVE